MFPDCARKKKCEMLNYTFGETSVLLDIDGEL